MFKAHLHVTFRFRQQAWNRELITEFEGSGYVRDEEIRNFKNTIEDSEPRALAKYIKDLHPTGI